MIWTLPSGSTVANVNVSCPHGYRPVIISYGTPEFRQPH
jgi:hypothetical protein